MPRVDPEPDPPSSPGWREVRVVDRTASTNADLAVLAAAGEPAGLVLVAREQTAGRGRLGRSWTSPPGSGLTFSVLLRPARDPSGLGWLTLLAGVAIVQAVQAVTGVPAALKWPNDVVVGTGAELRKLGGILAEWIGAGTRSGASGSGAVVVGVGLNVSLTAAELPAPTATSLLLEGAHSTDRTLLLDAVLQHLADGYARWNEGGPTADQDLRQAYRAACTTLGCSVRAELPGGSLVTGLAEDVDEAGRLVVRTADGLCTIGAGDVVHLR